MKNLIPWRRKEERTPAVMSDRRETRPVDLLQRRMNRMFEDFFEDFGLVDPSGMFPSGGEWDAPRFEVTETEDELRVRAELPGMDEEDVEILLDDNLLTIRGEKRRESEEKDRKRNVVMSEVSYGAFHRTLPLPDGIDADKVDARFKKGVLTLRLPRTETARANRRRIAVNAA